MHRRPAACSRNAGGGASRPFFIAVALTLIGLGALPPAAGARETVPPRVVRVATFNASLTRSEPGGLRRDLATGRDPQALAAARIIQLVRPDVLLLNEFDHDPDGEALRLFTTLYVGRDQRGSRAVRYRYRFSAPVNTGVPSGLDLDRDGRSDGPGDALGFGRFAGQYGMAVLSRWPIERRALRTYRTLLWREMPGNLLPEEWYPPEARATLPLSSKSHWDLPIALGAPWRLHLLASHPTPPTFDGPEDRNGRRNHDEIRFWADYLDPGRAAWIRDDAGEPGGLPPGAHFVIAGDLNADPFDGDSVPGAIAQLLGHPRVGTPPAPASAGAPLAAASQGGANRTQRGPPEHDTADFDDTPPGPGNLRVDYVLPSRTLAICASGVHWPPADETVARASDHRLVWVDLAVGGCAATGPSSRQRRASR